MPFIIAADLFEHCNIGLRQIAILICVCRLNGQLCPYLSQTEHPREQENYILYGLCVRWVLTHFVDKFAFDQFAPLVFDAIDRGAYWIIPQPEAFDDGFRSRNEAITARRNPDFFLIDQDA